MKSPFPQDWKEYTIGDCLRRVEHPVEVDSDALYTQIGIRSHGKGLFYKEPVTGELLGNKAVYWIEPDCFILNIVFAWEQAIGKTTQAEVGMIGSHRFPMYKPVNNLVDIDYLVYYLLTKRGTDILEAASPGGAGRNRTLGQDRFMKSRIVLPPLDEQQKIAEILSTQDKAIELQGRKIEELKRFKKGCLEKMFPRKGQKVPEKRFPRFTDDWEQRKLGEVFNFHYGDGNNNPSNGGQYPVFGAGGIQGRYTKYNAENSIIIGHMGDAGCVSWGEGKHFVTYNGTITTPKDDVFTAKFGYYLLLNMNLRKYRGGSGLPFLTYDMLTEMETKCPNSKIETQEIADYFTQLDKLITLHQRKLEEMKKQKKALMQLLLTGIVRI